MEAAAAPAAQPAVCPITGAPLNPPKRRWGRKLALGAGALALLLALYILITTPFSRALQPVARNSLTFLASDGQPIARRGVAMEAPVDLRELPAHVPLAFMAIEDRRFLQHGGIDAEGLARAAVRNLFAGGVREGGSTITQQLARMTALSADRTAARKLREILLAWWLELRLSKEEIFERYVSNAYFGDGVYGLRAAARHYFDKPPGELSVGEAAMLAGLVNAPSRLAPTRNLRGARERGRLVVRSMVAAGYLDEEEADRLPRVRLDVERSRRVPSGSWFTDWVAGEMGESEASRVTIATTLDRRLQRLATAAVRRAAAEGAEVALVAMRPTGEVVAMVGGLDYRNSGFNRATQARRQPGSAFKLFVYLAALRDGMTPDTLVEDLPVTIGGWSPSNHDGRYRGPISLREAFAVSANAATVRLAEGLGRESVIETARDLGIESELEPRPSLALGTSELSLIELTAAYAAVASGRYPVRPRGLADEEEGGERGVLDRSTVHPMILDLLWQAANAGTGRAAALDTPTFGKTGTSQDYRDAWFVGFAGDLVTGIWIGRDDNRPLDEVSGGGLPAEIWRDFMSAALRRRPAAAAAVAEPEPVPVVRPRPPGERRERRRERDRGPERERDRDWEREREREWERDREREREGRGKGKGRGRD